MIIPLGLGGKLPRFPWITLSLAMILLIFFIGQLSKSRRVDQEVRRIIRQSQLSAVTFEMFYEFCKNHQVAEDACRSEAIKMGNKFHVDGFVRPKKKSKVSVKDAQKIIRIQAQFNNYFEKDLEQLRHLKHFKTYKKIRKRLSAELSALSKKEGLFSKTNRSFKALLLAQVSHSGIIHLLSNLFVLIVFGIYLEMRVNPLIFLGCYFIGGTVGLPTYYLFNPENSIHIVGASANIAALMGTFFIVFYRFRMLMGLFWFYAVRKTFFAQVSIVFPLLFILKDAIGLGSETGIFGGVAHSAHLGGLLVGILFGMIAVRDSSLQWPFRNHLELAQTESLKKLASVKSQSVVAKEILQQNPDNFHAHCIVLNSSLNQKIDFESDSMLSFWQDHLPGLMKICLRNKKLEVVTDLFEKMPLNFDLKKILSSYNRLPILQIADWAFDQGKFESAIRMYDVFISLYPTRPITPSLKETLRGLAILSGEDNQLMSFSHEYGYHQPESEFIKIRKILFESEIKKRYGTNI